MRWDYKWQAAIVVTLGLSLSLLDNTIVSVALPAMQRAFATDFSTITWVTAGYLLAQAAMIGVTGYLCDRIGTKTLFVAAMALFVAASALCMIAPSESVLIAMRVFQGLGAGVLRPLSFAIAYRAFPAAERGRATAIIGIPVLLAPAFGPVVGGYLTTAYTWRAMFGINLPLGLVALLLAWRILRGRAEETAADDDPAPGAGRFDGVGFVLAMIGFTALISGLTEAGSRGWSDPLVVWCLAGGALALLTFSAVEFAARSPVLDLRLFLNGTFARANLLLWALVAFYYGGVYLIPYFFENVRGYSAMTSGEMLIGQGLASAVGIAVAGMLYNRVGPRLLAIAGVGLLAASMAGFTTLSVTTSGSALQAWLLLRGLGLGLATQPLQNLAMAVVTRQAMARASSLSNVTQQVAGAAGLGSLAAYLAQRAAVHGAILSSHPTAGAGTACLTASCVHRQATVLGLNDAFALIMAGYAACLIMAPLVGADPSRRTRAATAPAAGPRTAQLEA